MTRRRGSPERAPGLQPRRLALRDRLFEREWDANCPPVHPDYRPDLAPSPLVNLYRHGRSHHRHRPALHVACKVAWIVQPRKERLRLRGNLAHSFVVAGRRIRAVDLPGRKVEREQQLMLRMLILIMRTSVLGGSQSGPSASSAPGDPICGRRVCWTSGAAALSGFRCSLAGLGKREAVIRAEEIPSIELEEAGGGPLSSNSGG